MGKSLNSLLNIIESTNGKMGERAATLLVEQLTQAISELLWLSTRSTNRVIRQTARNRLEFPSLISLSRKTSNDYQDLILHRLKLGTKLPFHIDPRTTYTPYTRLAMQIIRFIDADRHRKRSIYRKVVPDLHEKDFLEKHSIVWDKVIGFHLDFFQSPQARRIKLAKQQFGTPLQDALDSTLLAEEKRNFARQSTLSPFGEITAMLEFRYRRGKKVKVKSPGEFYNRVKHKVIDAALALIPK